MAHSRPRPFPVVQPAVCRIGIALWLVCIPIVGGLAQAVLSEGETPIPVSRFRSDALAESDPFFPTSDRIRSQRTPKPSEEDQAVTQSANLATLFQLNSIIEDRVLINDRVVRLLADRRPIMTTNGPVYIEILAIADNEVTVRAETVDEPKVSSTFTLRPRQRQRIPGFLGAP